MRQFLLRLSSARKPIGSVVVQLGLERAQSRSGVKYSLIQPRKVGELTPAMAQRAADIAATIMPGLGDPPAREAA
jgi:hypothetical protein